MKHLKILVLAAMMCAVITNCSKKEEVDPQSTKYISNDENYNRVHQGNEVQRIRIGRGSPGLEGDPRCQGTGECGPCRGICIIISFKIANSPLTNIEINHGFGLVEVEIPSPGKFHMIPHFDVDRGDGFVDIANDFFIGQEVSNFLEFNQVTIKQGLYQIDYSSLPAFGEITFDIITL